MGGYVDDVSFTSGASGLSDNQQRIRTGDFNPEPDGLNIPPGLIIGGMLVIAAFWILRNRR